MLNERVLPLSYDTALNHLITYSNPIPALPLQFIYHQRDKSYTVNEKVTQSLSNKWLQS